MPEPSPINLAIYDFEGALEPAFQTGLNRVGLANAPKTMDAARLTHGRVEVLLLTAAVRNQFYVNPVTKERWLYIYDAALTLKIVTNRVRGQQNLHRQMRAAVRYMAQHYTDYIQPHLQFHTITLLQENGTHPEFREKDDEDISALGFSLVFNIKQSAFPNHPTQ